MCSFGLQESFIQLLAYISQQQRIPTAAMYFLHLYKLKATCPSVLPGCSLPWWGSWADRQWRFHRHLPPGHSLCVRQTAGTSSSHQGQQVSQWLGPSWGSEQFMCFTSERDKTSETERDRQQTQTDSHAGVQVPDLQLSFVKNPKYSGPLWGPLEVIHCSLGGSETQHRLKVVPLPQLDGPVRGAAQECIVAKGRPCDAVHRTLRRKEFT